MKIGRVKFLKNQDRKAMKPKRLHKLAEICFPAVG